jgi:hypothetical protein
MGTPLRRWWLIGAVVVAAAGAAWHRTHREGRADWLAAIQTAAPVIDHCAPLMDDSAIAFVMLHKDLDRAVRRGEIQRLKEDSAAIARHLTVVDPVAAAAALHLAEVSDIDTARRRFADVERLLQDPARPRASDNPQPAVIVSPAVD